MTGRIRQVNALVGRWSPDVDTPQFLVSFEVHAQTVVASGELCVAGLLEVLELTLRVGTGLLDDLRFDLATIRAVNLCPESPRIP